MNQSLSHTISKIFKPNIVAVSCITLHFLSHIRSEIFLYFWKIKLRNSHYLRPPCDGVKGVTVN